MSAIRLTSIFAAIAMVVSLATGALAEGGAKKVDVRTYKPAAFSQAQADNKHIVLEVFKKGCGTCAAQQPSLKEARAKYPNATFMKFDFVNDTEAVEQFKVVKQSTIIVFKGKEEVARLIGETDRDAIIGAIDKGI